MPDVCKSCKAPVIWATTQNGNRMPVDSEPVEGGNIVLSHRRVGEPPVAVYQRKMDIAKLAAEHERSPQGGPLRLFASHFATCPHAQSHRRASHTAPPVPSPTGPAGRPWPESALEGDGRVGEIQIGSSGIGVPGPHSGDSGSECCG